MKTINLKKPEKTGKYYIFTLGNRKKMQFTQSYDCRTFVNQTSKFLTYKLSYANLIHGKAYTEFRIRWQYYDNHRTEGRAKKIQMEKWIIQEFQLQASLIDFCSRNSDRPGGVYMVWSNITKTFNSLVKVYEALIELNVQKSNFAEVEYFRLLIKVVDLAKKEMEDYPDLGN